LNFADPKLKAHIKEQLAKTKSPHYIDIETKNSYEYERKCTSHQTQSGISSTDYEIATSHNRYVSPTHVPHRQPSSRTTTPIENLNATSGHSRNSSNSSANICLGIDATTTATATSGGFNNTTPTTSTSTLNRPSRIPTALKPAPKHPPVQHSPQHKRPKPSQIPTKFSNGKTPPATSNNTQANPLQHSNSYSGSANCYTSPTHSSHENNVKNLETNSAPPQPVVKTPRFEAYMMTGDLILNLSRTPQSSNLLTTHAKKVNVFNFFVCVCFFLSCEIHFE